MHPYFAQELARERRTDLLGQQQFRHRHRKRSVAAGHAHKATPFARARHSLGRALVALGTRLLGGTPPATIELFTTRR
jgi:hypothetical protein